MRVASRLRNSHLASMAGLFGAALLVAAPPAAADRDDWDDRDHYDRPHRHHDRGHRHHPRRHHQHGDWCPPQHARPYAYNYGYGPTWYGPRVHRSRYYCEPCSHWYDDDASFRYHVHHHHHVPAAVIPLVIMATVFGAVFGGY